MLIKSGFAIDRVLRVIVLFYETLFLAGIFLVMSQVERDLELSESESETGSQKVNEPSKRARNEPDEVKCPNCGKKLKHEKNLLRHLKEVCTKDSFPRAKISKVKVSSPKTDPMDDVEPSGDEAAPK